MEPVPSSAAEQASGSYSPEEPEGAEPSTETEPPEPEQELPAGLRLRYAPDSGTTDDASSRSFVTRHLDWLVGLTICLAGLLAHGLCVRSTFYLDDWNQVVANDWVDHGRWWEAGPHAFTCLTYWLTYLLAGISAPAFHAGNLLLHLGTASVLAGFARRLLVEGAELSEDRSGRIAWWAGLLFAVHPLCSEVANYVRARDMELATLCSLLAAWAALRWRRQRRPKVWWPLLSLLAVLVATFCKEVGFILAAGMATLVAFGLDRSPGTQGHREAALALPGPVTRVKTKLVATPKDASLVQGNWPVTLSLTLVGVCIAASAWPAWVTAYRSLHHPMLGWHTLTKARVFWLGMGRVLLPIRLCSDHQIQWTRAWNDPAAWLSLLAQLGVIFWTGLLYFRRRGPVRTVGVLLALALLAVVHRLANPGAELMVEHRLYPAMGPLCILLAWGVDRLSAWGTGSAPRPAVGWAAITVLVLAGAVLSERRAQTWHTSETLVADVLAQYPLQNRARKELQDADIRAADWQGVLRRQPAMRQAFTEVRDFNAASTGRRYDIPLILGTHVATEGNCALALAELGRSQEALAHLDWLLGSLLPGMPNERAYKASLAYARGRVEEVIRQDDLAIQSFTESEKLAAHPETERALRRVQANKATKPNLPVNSFH